MVKKTPISNTNSIAPNPAPGGGASKSIKSYNRLLNAGFIKKDVFDNRIQKLSSPSTSTAKVPSNTTHNTTNNNPTASLTAACSRTAPSSQAVHPTSNNFPPATSGINAAKSNGLASHILSRGPISNLSGQYPVNGSPGRLLR